MSRIDNATLLINLKSGISAGQLRVYAVNYNVFNYGHKKYIYKKDMLVNLITS